MNNPAQLRFVADILERLLPAEHGGISVSTHPGMNATVTISYDSFASMFSGREVDQKPVGLDAYSMTSEMCGVHFSTTGYYSEGEAPVPRRVML